MRENKDSWDNYVANFNLLSDKMSENGIRIELLISLLESYDELIKALKILYITTEITTAG